MLTYYSKLLTSTDIHASIAKRLHNERVAANLSLDKLAEISRYSKPTVQRWEKGWKDGSGQNIIPTLDQIITLCSIYHCSPGYLLCEYDERTKQATDICSEIGLTEDSIKILQDYFSPIVTPPYHAGANNIFLAFLNFYIQNISLTFELLFNRHILACQLDDLIQHPDKEQLIEGFKAVSMNGLADGLFKDNIFPQMALNKQLERTLREYYDKQENLTAERKEYLIEEILHNLDALSPNKFKQSDFAFSDTFLGIVRDFFENYFQHIDDYNEFLDLQKDKHDKFNMSEEG